MITNDEYNALLASCVRLLEYDKQKQALASLDKAMEDVGFHPLAKSKHVLLFMTHALEKWDGR